MECLFYRLMGLEVLGVNYYALGVSIVPSSSRTILTTLLVVLLGAAVPLLFACVTPFIINGLGDAQ